MDHVMFIEQISDEIRRNPQLSHPREIARLLARRNYDPTALVHAMQMLRKYYKKHLDEVAFAVADNNPPLAFQKFDRWRDDMYLDLNKRQTTARRQSASFADVVQAFQRYILDPMEKDSVAAMRDRVRSLQAKLVIARQHA